MSNKSNNPEGGWSRPEGLPPGNWQSDDGKNWYPAEPYGKKWWHKKGLHPVRWIKGVWGRNRWGKR